MTGHSSDPASLFKDSVSTMFPVTTKKTMDEVFIINLHQKTSSAKWPISWSPGWLARWCPNKKPKYPSPTTSKPEGLDPPTRPSRPEQPWGRQINP
jgi:hypothetical protein